MLDSEIYFIFKYRYFNREKFPAACCVGYHLGEEFEKPQVSQIPGSFEIPRSSVRGGSYLTAPVAQPVEHVLGKDEATGSSPVGGF